MDKFERVEQYCTNGELAIKSEGMEDTFKDIAVYSTLAMILFRKEQDNIYAKKTLSKDCYADWEQDGKPPLHVDKHGNSCSKPARENRFIDVDTDGELGISLDARLKLQKESDIYKTALAQKEIAQRTIDEEIFLQDRDNRSGL